MSSPFGSPSFGRDPFPGEHDRARQLSAERLAGRLDDDEALWLSTHLAWCAPCRAVREEYEAQRLELRSLRLAAPQPPRALWAQTAAVLERETRPRPVPTLGAGTAVVRGRSPAPVGATSAILVVALVVGVSVLGGARILRPAATDAPRRPELPAATPFPVPVREVGLYAQLPDGRLALVTGRIHEVCPLEVASACTAAGLATRRLVDVGAARAQAVLQSPTRSQLVVVGRDADGSGVDLFVVPVPPEPPAPAPPPAAQLEPGSDPEAAAGESPATPVASGPAEAQPGSPVGEPDGTPGSAAAQASPSDPSAGDDPAGSPASPDPSADPAATTPPADEPTPTPVPVVDEVVQIASDVLIVGDVGAYAPDGLAFAFTARPADGRHGPDVFLWRAGEPEAVAVTTDHASVFSDWADEWLLISRVSGDVAPDGTQQPIAVLVEADTGIQRVLPMASAWRPIVDPTSRIAVWWDGSVRRDPAGSGWVGASGRLVLGDWRGPDGPAAPIPGAPAATVDVLAEGPIGDWQARWDETGTRLALWIAEPGNPANGRLSLFGIDAATGRLDPGAVLLSGAPALPGFSIGGGRLAWMRPGDDGTPRVVVVAWSETGIGQVELASGEESLAVIR